MSLNNVSKLLLVAILTLALGSTATRAGEDKTPPKKEEKKEEKKDDKKKDPKDMNANEAEAAGLCPVCKKESKPIYHYDVKDKTYHFATRKCQQEFASSPSKYGTK